MDKRAAVGGACRRMVEREPLRACLERALGVPDDHSEQIAEVLLDAELRGYYDHGVFFLGELANRNAACRHRTRKCKTC